MEQNREPRLELIPRPMIFNKDPKGYTVTKVTTYQMELENLDIHMRKSDIRPLCYTVHKSQPKWFKALGIGPEPRIS